METNPILNRIHTLSWVYAWASAHNKILTVGQRICLTQERAAWSRVLSADAPAKPFYTIPQHLEDKVAQIVEIITETNWDKPENPEIL
ncbi:MAG: hypothetical protein CMF34_01980 [Leeuwenhoekiella sp.]|nr:hypothetical protein [Leeuwenhoekiella sp.]MBH13595.1 hypothetical protein [Leeuwenhoekiella sp.]HAX16375.1 hypothetical protein [Leeuwenhoekiella sp.]|tara:strand:+ start:5976 stop:6239 length:264 start_codon:yes stop_codon:yes gene_type:complete